MENIDNYKLYKNIIDNISEGVILSDEFFNVTFSNDAFLTITGFSIEELKNKQFSDFILIENFSCPLCSKNTSTEYLPEKFVHKAEILTKKGEKAPVKVSHNLIKEENKYVTVITPLSDAICLNQAHMDFVGTVSHELRTPLTSIKGFADTLLTAGDKLPKEQQIRFINIIKSQVDRLTRLVEDLLTVSRLESRKDNSIYKTINLKKLVEPIIQTIQQKAPEHNFKIDLTDGIPDVWADSDKLEQILTNLIDNAAKYSYPESLVTLKACCDQQQPDFINIKITDQGVGIPQEHLSTIFTKFSRIDNSLSREVQGTGLGLYITKSLVEKMNGKITVESNEKGSTFCIQLPIATYERQTSQKFNNREQSCNHK